MVFRQLPKFCGIWRYRFCVMASPIPLVRGSVDKKNKKKNNKSADATTRPRNLCADKLARTATRPRVRDLPIRFPSGGSMRRVAAVVRCSSSNKSVSYTRKKSRKAKVTIETLDRRLKNFLSAQAQWLQHNYMVPKHPPKFGAHLLGGICATASPCREAFAQH